jgi:hypothetical protein
MPPFVESMLHWASVTRNHFVFMFWWIWMTAVVLTALSESFWVEGRRRRLLERPADGWRTVWLAVQLGVLSPPSRRRMFRQAKELLARGVSPAGVMAYLVASQSLFIWLLIFIVELDGPQPMIGQLVAVGAALAVLVYGVRRTPERLWESARGSAAQEFPETAQTAPIGQRGPVWVRLPMSVAGQAYSLWWPMLFGLLGLGFFLALGQSPGYLSLQGTNGPFVQLANSGVGLLLAYMTGAPLVGNALFAAGLWRPEFVTYAGLSAFYLGTLVMPFALPRYFALLGVELTKKVLVWLIIAILVGALTATAWWWGLDWLAGVLGLRDLFESLTHSTLRPNDVPWFHHWFQPSGVSGMQGM